MRTIEPEPVLAYDGVVAALAPIRLPEDIDSRTVEELYAALVVLDPQGRPYSIQRFEANGPFGFPQAETKDRFVVRSCRTQFDNGNRAGWVYLVERRREGWAVLGQGSWIN